MLDARADALNEKTHRLALHLGKAFDAQNIMLSRRLRHFRKKFLRRAKRRHIDDEAFKVVMVMGSLGVVMRGTLVDIGFRGCADPEQNRWVEAPVCGLDHFDGSRRGRPDFFAYAGALTLSHGSGAR